LNIAGFGDFGKGQIFIKIAQDLSIWPRFREQNADKPGVFIDIKKPLGGGIIHD
jgi:hypothetical protein